MKYLKNIHEHKNNISVVSKKLILGMVFLFGMSFSVNATKNNVVEKTKAKKVITVKTKSATEEDETLHCKITTPDGTVYECWLCNCGNLIKAIKQV